MNTLNKALELEESSLKTKSGRHVLFSKTGPVSLCLIKEIISIVEMQEKQITTLQQMVNALQAKIGKDSHV
jgi:hypothetical protein